MSLISMQSHELSYNLGIIALTTGINCTRIHVITYTNSLVSRQDTSRLPLLDFQYPGTLNIVDSFLTAILYTVAGYTKLK